MANYNLEAFVPEIARELPSCPQPLIMKVIKEQIQYLCTRTWCWQESRVVLFPAGETLSVENPILCGIKKAWVNGVNIPVVTYDQMSALWLEGDQNNPTVGNVAYVALDNEYRIGIYPVPQEDTELVYIGALALMFSDSSIPEQVFYRMKAALKHAVLRDLLVMFGEPWADSGPAGRDRAAYHARLASAEFNRLKLSAKVYEWVPRDIVASVSPDVAGAITL